MRMLLQLRTTFQGFVNTSTNVIPKNGSRLCRMSYSSSAANYHQEQLVKTDLEVETGIATMTLNRHPANSLSMEMLQAMSEAIKSAEANKSIQALVVSSSLPSIFCAGLDLTELYEPDPVRLRDFWRSFQNVYLDLYGSRLATIAAMGGHAPAGGCMVALSCDYRIMSAGQIGLNESKLGIVAPPWLAQQYVDTIGQRQAELGLSLGTLFSPEEAFQIGLIDEVVAEDVVGVAMQRAIDWVRIPAQARVAGKELTRGRQINDMLKSRDLDVEHFCSFILNKKVQQSLGAYLEQMAKRKK